jgi:hypothetical protein
MTEVPNNYAEMVKAKRLARGWTNISDAFH